MMIQQLARKARISNPGEAAHTSGLFVLNSIFLRMNQAHRSHARSARDLTTPHPWARADVLAYGIGISRLASANVCFNPDCVAKVPKRCAPNFPLKDEPSDDRRSMYPQARQRSCQ